MLLLPVKIVLLLVTVIYISDNPLNKPQFCREFPVASCQ